MKTRPTRRGGYTLLELLLVIAMMAALAALGAGTYFRIAEGQRNGATVSALNKINSGLDRRWRYVIDQAAKDSQTNQIPAAVMTLAGNDKDRARAVWTYLRLRNEFPTTVKEAQTDITVTSGGQTYVLQHRGVFDQIGYAASIPPEIQSAACLYQALTATGNGGETMAADGIGNQTTDVVVSTMPQITYRTFVDAWGTPIAFCRMAYSPEVNGTPWTPASAAFKDFCDPTGKLLPKKPVATWTTNGNNSQLHYFWALATGHGTAGHHLPYVINGTQFSPATYPTDAGGAAMNWVPTAISAGANKSFYAGYPSTTGGPILGGDGDSNDNILSFRLRQEGNRGE